MIVKAMEAMDTGMEEVSQILMQLSQAQGDEEAVQVLEGIAPILSTPQERMKYKLYLETEADLNVLFKCLESSDEKLVATTTSIVNHLFDFLSSQVILDKYWRALVECLENHQNSQVRRTAVRFLKKSCVDFRPCQELVLAVVKALVDEDLGVAVDAKDVLHAQISRDHNFGSQDVFGFHSHILNEMAKNEKETLRMRLYDFVVAVAKISPQLANQSCHGLLGCLCAELFGTEDFLFQLSVLELLIDLCESDHGHAYLREHGVLAKLDAMINTVAASPFASMLLPGFIKFFGRVAQRNPSDFTDAYPNFTSTLFNLLGGEGDEDLRTLALETVGFVATTPEGKIKLNSFGPENIVDILTRLLSRGSSEQKIKALSTIANILQGEPDNMTENFFQALDLRASGRRLPTMVELLFDLIKQPFADMTQVSYSVLDVIAGKSWGLTRLAAHPGLIEYLLDRSQLRSKEAKDARFDLNKTITTNLNAEQVLQPQNLRRLKQYIRDGPYHVEAQVEVALDEGA